MENDALLHSQDSAAELFRAIGRNWHLVALLIGFLITLVGGWTHFETQSVTTNEEIASLQNRIGSVEASTLTASVNYATLAGKIDTVNSNINILLKANHLQ